MIDRRNIMSKLKKDDPVYYKRAINKLIKQAKDNDLEIGYEIDERDGKVTNIGVCFINDMGEMAIGTVYKKEVAVDKSGDKGSSNQEIQGRQAGTYKDRG